MQNVYENIYSAGDVNGDGFEDTFMGNAKHLVYGSTNFPPDWQAIVGGGGTNANESVAFLRLDGSTLSGTVALTGVVGDINGDGFADIIYSSGFTNGTSLSWGAWLVYGGRDWPSQLDVASWSGSVRFVADNPPNRCSWQFVAAGDVDRDKFDDLFVSYTCANASTDRPNAGAVYLLYGSDRLPSTMQLESLSSLAAKFVGGHAGDRIGSALDGSGDFNADGYNDIVIGSETANYSRGAVYVVFGSRDRFAPSSVVDLATLNAASAFVVHGSEPYGFLGKSVRFGDIDTDGVADVLTGAPFTTGHSHPGTFYAFLGSSSTRGRIARDLTQLAPTEFVEMQGDESADWTGYSAAVVGDMNGDGYNDWYVISPGYSSTTYGYEIKRSGHIFLVFGRPQSLMRKHLTPFPTNAPIVGPFNYQQRSPCDCPCGMFNLNLCPYCNDIAVVEIQYYHGACKCVQW